MHDPIRAKYLYASLVEAISRLINAKKMENETLLDYVKRFKSLSDVLRSYMGTKILEELEESGFIRKYNYFGKSKRDSLFQLIDFYSLFYFNFMILACPLVGL